MVFLKKAYRFHWYWSLSMVAVPLISFPFGYGALHVFALLLACFQSIFVIIKLQNVKATLWMLHIPFYLFLAEYNMENDEILWCWLPILILINGIFGQVLIRVIIDSWNNWRWFKHVVSGGLIMYLSVLIPIEFNFIWINEILLNSLILIFWFIGAWMASLGLRVESILK